MVKKKMRNLGCEMRRFFVMVRNIGELAGYFESFFSCHSEGNPLYFALGNRLLNWGKRLPNSVIAVFGLEITAHFSFLEGVMRRFEFQPGQLRIRSVVIAALFSLGIASAAKASLVFASFAGNMSDGFGSFNNGVVPFSSDTTGSTYSYSTYGDTDGDSSALEVTETGYKQDLAYDFAANGLTSAFLANDAITFDLTSPPAGASTAGYWQLYQVFLNAPGGGFTQIGAAPYYNQYYYSGFAGSTAHITINYDAYKATMSANPGYVQMIFALNNGGGAPNNFFFDNFQLITVPEPASFSILGLSAAALLSRRRRR